MIVGLRNVVDAVGRYKDDLFNSDGGMWIVALDGLLLIPVILAAFFYPIVALELTLAMVVVSVIGMVLVRAYHRGHLHLPHRHHKM